MSRPMKRTIIICVVALTFAAPAPSQDAAAAISKAEGWLFETVGAEDWLDDPELATDSLRGDARDRLCERVGAWCAERSSDEVLEVMAGAGVPAGPVLDLESAIRHPQADALGALADVAVPGTTLTAPVANLPIAFSRSTTGIESPPPEAGQHSDAILGALGYTPEAIAAFRESGVI